jgi:UDP-N-acetylglucosamine--N-acetylmuramyl-(pentapeptide) pyrophosphoryl-undecaprenol N-acetylglucosamine transferase
VGHRAIIAGGGTGGHLYPALNLAEALQRRGRDDFEVLLVGAKRGIEAQVLPERDVEFRLLELEPIYRSRVWRNWRLARSAITSSREILRLFKQFEPDLVVGTGGYAAGPVVGWAAIKGLPTAIQEQNSYPGLTTRWLAPYVDQLHLGYEEAVRMLWPGNNTDVTVHGNPIRWPDQRPHPDVVRKEFGLGPGRVVLIVGGSQGATPINDAVITALGAVKGGKSAPLPPDAQLLWATGPAHFKEVRRQLERLRGRVPIRTVPYVSEMERALSIASLAVSRAGALALSELCAWGVPSVLVPLPHAAADHQRWNARSLAADGAAVVVEERDMIRDPGELWRTIVHLLQGPTLLEQMSAASQARGKPHAAVEIASDLWRLMEDR